MLGNFWKKIFGDGSDKINVQPPPKPATFSVDWEDHLYFDTRAFTLKGILSLLPSNYMTDSPDVHLLGWAFELPAYGKITDIIIKSIEGRYTIEEDSTTYSTLDLEKKLIPGAVLLPFNIRQRRVPIDCGVPMGMTQSPAVALQHEILDGPISMPPEYQIPIVDADDAKNFSYEEADQHTDKTITVQPTSSIDELDEHRPWVGRIIFSATDLLYMRYLLETQTDYEDIVFSGALIDYGDMLNSKSRIEQFSQKSDRFSEGTGEVLVPNPSRVFTLKAELTGNDYPSYEQANSPLEKRAQSSGQEEVLKLGDSPPPPTAPAVFIGLPCPTYWEEMDGTDVPEYDQELSFLRRELARIVPVANGQWQELLSRIKPADIQALHEQGKVSYHLPAPPSQPASDPDDT